MNCSLRTALVTSLSAIALAAPAMAQDTASPPVADDANSTIVVTGTRATARTVADSPVPVDVISGDQLTQSGFTETNRLLNEQIPSFNFPQPSITDGTDVIRPATLRGLNPDQTLVLVNGKRRHTSALLNINGSVGRGTAAVDINLIPSIALKRVEVLRDGAAAQYGSDAIAGVINFQLRDARDFGGRFTATYGQYETRVNGIQEVTGLALGVNGQPTTAPDGTFNVVTTGRDRRASDGQTLTLAGTVGLPLAEEGYLNLSAEFQDRDPTNRTGYDRRRQYNLINGAVDPRELTFNRLSHRYGDAKTQDMKLFLNTSSGSIGDSGFELYSFASYNFRDGESAGFFRLPNDARNVPAIYPDGFLPLITTETNDFSGTVGTRGELGGFRVDLSGGYARNAIHFNIENTLNASLGAASPRAFDAGELSYSQALANLDVSREFEFGGFNSVTLAGGLEYRRETFQITPGEVNSYRNGGVTVGQNTGNGSGAPAAPGAQVFSGFQPVIGGQRVDRQRARHNISAYAEIDAEISDALGVQLAGRFEDYSDFGSDWNGKAAVRFEPISGFALRGAISTGFRAPSLQQQFYAAAATNNVNGVLLDTVTLPVDNPVAIALGARPLEPETSLSYSAGVVFTAVPRLSLTVDVYQIDIDDRIVVTDNLTATRNALGQPTGTSPGINIATILNNAGFPTVSAARFFVNGLDSRTRGLDAVATYRFEAGDYGRFGFTAGFNYNKTTIRRLLASPGPLANINNLVLFGRQEQGRIVRGQPKTKLNLGLDYDLAPIGFTLRANRYGKVEGTGSALAPGVFNDNFLDEQWVTDLEVRADLGRFELAVGANNLFDTYPTLVPTGQAGTNSTTGAAVFFPTTNFVAPYSNFSPNGFNGRFLYGRVTVKF